MVYDPADGYTLLFGGCPSWGGDYWGHNCTALGDTWKLADGVWTNITSTLSGPSPGPRFDAGIAYDSVDRVVVLFGGLDRLTVYSDTWTYAAGQWTHVHPTSSPSARFAPGMASDGVQGVLLFGGANSTQNTITYNDTWSYAGGRWTQLSTPVAPAARFSMGMTYNSEQGFILLYGGFNFTALSFGDTWRFTGGAWTEVSASSAPPAENYPSMAFDPEAGAVIMTGGHNGWDLWAVTWAYNSSTGWASVATPTYPIACWGISLSYDPSTGGVWWFGGYYPTVAPYGVYLNSTWEFFPSLFPVTFSETGLPSGTSWGVSFNGSLQTSTGTSISFHVANGMYSYEVRNVSGFLVAPSSGTQLVLNAGATVGVVFAPIPPSPTPSGSSSSSGTGFVVGAFVGAVVAGGLVAGVFLLRSRRPPFAPPAGPAK